MKKLDEKEWNERTLEDLFLVKAGKRLTNADKIDGDRPFIGATDNNNGVTGFVANENSSLDQNVLGVNYNGAPCIAFYHPYECIFTDDVKRLHLRHQPDQGTVLLFFKTIVMQQRNKYSYGYKFKEKRMLRQKLMLPVTDSGEPDYDYMEQYSYEMVETMLTRYKKYVATQLSNLKYREILALDEKEWRPIYISDMFEFVKGRENNMAMLEDGDIPLISAKANNNGLKGFVNSPKKVIAGRCITLNNDGDGGAGLAYYQPANMALDTHVTALMPNFSMSMFAMLFIAECISGLHGFFGHGLSISNRRVKRIRIMLPVTDSGEPDYEYMEQYAKNMMVRKYEQYLAFLDKREETD
ncbi:restriction endonuclease subunit S [Alloscardovia criceti]|uniref:restriction endonuclease subunit S n=1 Tax=Alloscardovia criceti TaxID=356828 RepID=UPI00037BD861|nr:restriction endonuclease subunit S [Alloscardovia criceti]